ncbi:hypothetical protein BT63DRAFT_483214 [Microthyrium microscopicum]|uniref:Uncharacterized protein n=1 Tax=Microthyrium microscopicum TaxID=703497 RepID=A0A6A6TXR8_9PEZI|nr:hypothetical protein BT63DRAFT_483214 [Microthyrium microscopicum]
MKSTMILSKWMTLRFWLIISLGLVLLLDVVALICTSIWAAGRRISKDEDFYREKPTNSQLAFYGFTAPLITLFLIPVQLFLTAKNRLSTRTTLCTSVVLLCGWIAQISFWFFCEISAQSILEWTPLWCPNVSRDPAVGQAKAYLGLFIAIGFCIAMSVSAAAVHRKQRFWVKKSPMDGIDKHELISSSNS